MGAGISYEQIATVVSEASPAELRAGLSNLSDAQRTQMVELLTVRPGSPPRAQSQASEPGRYTEPDAIWAALERGSVALLRMTWLIELAEAGGVLPRRQDIPEAAFIGVEELKRICRKAIADSFGNHNHDKLVPILTISFCWDEPGHPDPRGVQLQTVAAALRRLRDEFAGYWFTEMGVFWDWGSLYQRDPSLWQPFMSGPMSKPDEALSEAERAERDKYMASRSPEENEAFAHALHETMVRPRASSPRPLLLRRSCCGVGDGTALQR